MDLDRCPRCKEPWARGFEKCRKCGFVPIGAGLKDRAPVKKKKVRYRDPGSSWGCLFPVFLGLAVYGLYRYQPWTDDWEMVRAWFGQGRHHSIEGEWDVAQVLRIKKDPNGILGTKSVKSGVLDFEKDGTVKLTLVGRNGEASASGKYLVSGVLIALSGLQATDPSMPFPQKAKLQLAWTGPDQVVASTATESLYLRRKNKGGSPLAMIQMGLEQKGGAPIRGAVASMEGQMREDQ